MSRESKRSRKNCRARARAAPWQVSIFTPTEQGIAEELKSLNLDEMRPHRGACPFLSNGDSDCVMVPKQ